jgi:hypothetical protein
MLSKQELKDKNIQFWTDFKSYMSKHKSTTGRRINWINYPTEIKFIFLRLEVDKFGARICFDIQAKDSSVREIIWEQMEELKKVMESSMGEDGTWNFNYSTTEISSFSRIKWELDTVNYFRESDEEPIFKFFEEKLIAFDEFYQDFKDILILLVK